MQPAAQAAAIPPVLDVPYVPTAHQVVDAMIRLANVRPGDVVYDLGCGDGRLVVAAARRGARAVGVDLDPRRVVECHDNARRGNVSDRVRFECRSLFDVDVRDATVVFVYLLPGMNVRLRPRLLSDLRPGARVVANSFDIGDWPPDAKAAAHHRQIYLWVVPAPCDGRWRCVVNAAGGRTRMTLTLRQRYQRVWGTARVGRDELPLVEPRLVGDRLTFTLLPGGRHRPPVRYTGHVAGRTLRGTCRAEAPDAEPAAWGGVRG